MKKQKFFLASLAAIGAITLSSCQSTTNPETPDNSGNVSTDNTVLDAWEEGSRPDFGSDFDYDSTYVPGEVPDVNLEVTLTLSEKSPITFKDGTRTKNAKINSKLTMDDFDMSAVPESRSLEGFASYNSDGELQGTFTLDSFAVGKIDLTLLPFFTADSSYTSLTIGSGSVKKFNFDKVPGSITENGTIQYEADALVYGGKDSFVEKGARFIETSPITLGSGLRLDTTSSLITDDSAVYEFVYNFENYGTTAIHLDAYQIAASAEYKGQYKYEERYRMDIDLEPGESCHYVAQYSLTSNKNALTYMVADRTMSSGMDLGMSMSMKKTTLTQPETVSEPEAATTGKVKLKLPKGIDVKDFNEDQTAGRTITVPTDDQITNNTGREILGWYIVSDTGFSYVSSSTTVSDTEEITIAPYFNSTHGETLYPAKTRNNVPDYHGLIDSEGTFTEDDTMTENFVGTEKLIDDVPGLNLKYNGSLVTNNYFRLLTAAGKDGITAGHIYRFHYSIKNNSSSSLSFTMNQVQSGKSLENAVSNKVTLESNASTEFDIEITLANKNTNIMSLFVMDDAITNMDMDIQIAKTYVGKPEAGEKYTLTLGGDADVSFADGKTASLEEGDKLPTVTNNTGRTIAGYYDSEGNKYSADTFAMPASNLTLYPYFGVKEGYTRLWASSGKANGVPSSGTLGAKDNQANWTVIGGTSGYDSIQDTYKTIVKGKNGMDEEGDYLEYKAGFSANDSFRLDNALPSGSTVALNNTYQFMMNFENRSSEALSFKVYVINSGTDTTSCENHSFDLDLASGAYTTVEISPKYLKGYKNNQTNTNTLLYFVSNTAVTNGMKLAVSMGINLTPVTETEETTKYNLTLGGDSGVTFADNTKTAKVEKDGTLPTVTNNTGRTIAGYYDSEGNKYTSEGFTMPEKDLTLYPYFAVKEGYTRLWANSGKANGKPGTMSSTITADDWTQISSSSGYNSIYESAKTIVKGKNGMDEEGVLFNCTHVMKKDEYFRFDTAVSADTAATPIQAGSFAYSYNFENRSSGTMKFNMYVVNSGTSKTSCTDNTFTLTLAPGEYTTVEITPTYSGTNKNSLLLFEASEDFTSTMNLAVSMSINLNTTTSEA